MGVFGPGLIQSLQYMAEVNKFCSKGIPGRHPDTA
jgi:hypothetical protein